MNKKSILLIAAFLTITFASFSQIEKKDILIGGTFGFNTGSQSENSNNSNANINPRIGYAIGTNSVLSARFGFGYSNSKNENLDYRFRAHSFSTGLSWKKFFSFNDKLGWYTDVYSAYNFSSSKWWNTSSSSTPNETTSKGFSAGIAPGIYFTPVKGMIISADIGGVGYNYSKSKDLSSGSRQSGISANFLNSFNFGIDFIINKKKK